MAYNAAMFGFDRKEKSEEIVRFIQESCKTEKYERGLVGVSGGVDSATSLIVAVTALGKEHVFPVLLPYGNLHGEHMEDAWFLIDSLGIPKKQVNVIEITSLADAAIATDPDMDDIRKGNIMARMRMVILFDLHKKLNGLVLGTENKTEHLLGYYTRFGDEASDIEPLRSLYKTQVFSLAEYLGVPDKILQKPPSAGLWPGQTDEDEFGFSYKTVDEILYWYHEKGLSKTEIIKNGFAQKLVNRIWWWVEKGETKTRLPHILE